MAQFPLTRRVFLATCGAAVPLLAQEPARSATEPSDIVVDVTRVNILYTVTDNRGRFITDLTKEDFRVFEDKREQEIREFAAESDLPLRLAILIDTSNSIRDRLRFQQEAAVEFLNSVMRRQDRAALVSFDTSATAVSTLTEDVQSLADQIRDLRAGGGTALYDAVFYACRDHLGKDQPRYKFRRAMVVLSDGEDTQSVTTRDQALEMAQKNDVVIYTISTNISRQTTTGDKVLKYFAEETGGLVFFPFKVEDLAQSFENIANELRHQYNLAYSPKDMDLDGGYRTIEIKVARKGKFIVRARKGYYAPTRKELERRRLEERQTESPSR